MQSFPKRCGAATWLAIVPLLLLAAGGCKGTKLPQGTVTFTCGDQTVSVNPNTGADPQAVYVCEGDTVTWSPNGHTFLVEFKKDSPFADDGKKFDNSHPKSAKSKHFTTLKVHEYKITVDGTVFDPQVIGGGGTH